MTRKLQDGGRRQPAPHHEAAGAAGTKAWSGACKRAAQEATVGSTIGAGMVAAVSIASGVIVGPAGTFFGLCIGTEYGAAIGGVLGVLHGFISGLLEAPEPQPHIAEPRQDPKRNITCTQCRDCPECFAEHCGQVAQAISMPSPAVRLAPLLRLPPGRSLRPPGSQSSAYPRPNTGWRITRRTPVSSRT